DDRDPGRRVVYLRTRADAAAAEARVGAVGRVVDGAAGVRIRERQLVVQRHDAALPAHGGGVDARVVTLRAQRGDETRRVADHDRSDLVDLVLPVDVARARGLADAGERIAPAGGFGDDGVLHVVVQGVPAGDGVLVAQRSAVGRRAVDAIGEERQE